MKRYVRLVCPVCGKVFNKPIDEYRRRIKEGHTEFFCSLSCAAVASNKRRKAKTIEKICPVCGKSFTTTTNSHEKTFCSRSCASKGSMTIARRRAQSLAGKQNKGNLQRISISLKQREGWKYTEIDKALKWRAHEFEYPIGGYVFDLALLDVNILVEFDGPNHRTRAQINIDKHKESIASDFGFTVVHRAVVPATVIPASKISGL